MSEPQRLPDSAPAEPAGARVPAMPAASPHAVDLVLRTLDIAIASTVLLVSSPLLVLAALTILATSGRPVFFRGPRLGKGGDEFTIYKFRTLRPDAAVRLEPFYGEELSRRTAGEITRFGRWLRASQLDEIPQLWNVLRGDMSVVGPRPIRPSLYAALCERAPESWQRLLVRPGLTGYAQMRLTRESPWEHKLGHELEFIAYRSVSLYMRVVVLTIARVVRQALPGRHGGDVDMPATRAERRRARKHGA